ncbi:MAG: Ig-like domain-containing protein, partial [Pseudomonadota bacterium]
MQSNPGPNLIINGEFETHPTLQFAGWGFFQSITGWTALAGEIEIQELAGPSGNQAGDAVAELDSTQNSTVQQTVTIDTAGTYALSFEYALGWNNPSTNGMQVIVDGQVIDTLQPTAPGYQAYTVELALAAGTVDIAFAAIGPSDGRGTHIDTVSLVSNTSTGGGNQDPIAVNDTATTDENIAVSINVLGNDSDPDGGTPQIDTFGQGSNGSVTQVGNQLVYTPNTNFDGPDSFTYTISDGQGGTASATVDVQVNDVPPQPATNLIINGEFETHPTLQFAGWGFFQSITGWTALAGEIEIQELAGPSGNQAGDAVAELDATRNSTVQQTVTINTAGTYTLSFEYALGWNNPSTNGMQVIVDGQVIDTLQPTAPGYQAYTVELALVAGTVDIAFAAIGPSDGRGTHIDTVSLFVTDTSANAIDDTFDLESDSGSTNFNVLTNDAGSALDVTGFSAGTLGAPVSVQSQDGRSGTITLSSDGTLVVDPGTAFDDLGPGATDTLTLTYDVADSGGDTDTAQITINITGQAEGELNLTGTSQAVVVDLRDNTLVNAARILPLGDSITDGLAISGSYRALLWDTLVQDNGLWLDYVGNFSNNPGPNLHDPDHQGIPFGSATTAAADINATLTSNPTDIALIMLGTNDIAFEN